MNRLSSIAAASCLGLASLMVMPNALADQWNKKTILTVNEPIQVPGKVLQPGKYVMKLLDSPSNRHIVQIFNDREDQIQTTVLAIPNYRLQPTGKTEFQWWEVPAGQPKALRAWFYPGDNFGQEFAYPKNEAVQIATVTHETVPTTTATEQTQMANADVNRVDQSGTMSTYESGQQSASTETQPSNTGVTNDTQVAQTPAPSTDNTQMAQNTPPADNSGVVSDQGTRARTSLPHTASPLPLVGIAGFFALGASIALRAAAKRSV
jgi:hypothetical protein